MTVIIKGHSAQFNIYDNTSKPLPPVSPRLLPTSNGSNRIEYRLSDLPRFTITFRWSVYDQPHHRLYAGPRGLWRGYREN